MFFVVRPVIKVPQSRVFAREGDDVVIECTIEAFPKGYHYWELPSGTLDILYRVRLKSYTFPNSQLIIPYMSVNHIVSLIRLINF